ncbi:transcriptional regulator [Escherichia coli]|nr:transcriptional regulator [Escherichia coli]
MSPLRYQKWLRLNEVRRQMLNEHYDVTTAAYAVGYESYPISVGNIRGCLESHPREILDWPPESPDNQYHLNK